MASPRKPPGRPTRVLGATLLALALVSAVATVVLFLGLFPQPLHRVPLAGQQGLHFAEPGSHEIYLERDCSDDTPLRGLRLELVPRAGGEGLQLSSIRFRNSSYQFGVRCGEGLWSFDLEQAGEYRVTATPADPAAARPGREFTFTKGSLLGSLLNFGLFFVALFSTLLLGPAGVLLLLLSVLGRKGSRPAS